MLKRVPLLIILALFGVAPISLPPARAVYAGNFDGVVTDAEQGAGFGGSSTGDVSQIDTVIAMVVTTLTIIIGVVAVIMILIAGFKYITANGDGQKISSAKSTMIYAIIGLIVAALAQVIVQFVLNQATGGTVPGSGG